MEPNERAELEEFLRACDRLIKQHMIDEEYEEIAYMVYIVRQEETTVPPYDDVDDLTASIAFSKLSSID